MAVRWCKALTSYQTESSRWAAEVAADTIAGRQSISAPLGWPSKALCDRPKTGHALCSQQGGHSIH